VTCLGSGTPWEKDFPCLISYGLNIFKVRICGDIQRALISDHNEPLYRLIAVLTASPTSIAVTTLRTYCVHFIVLFVILAFLTIALACTREQ
jgi:hypothetical protein